MKGTPVTALTLRAMKAAREKIVCLTAYDALSGELAQEAGVDAVLVGDSLGNVIQGRATTLPVTLDDVCYHLRCVRRVVLGPQLVADLPFGSYGGSVAQAFESASRLMKDGAEAVKLEGAYLDEVRALVKAGIPVMGHLGFTPQSVHQLGGFRVQGKDDGETILAAAQALQDAGIYAVVLELIPGELAGRITATLEIPTIGIGAGPDCDGEIQVFHDITGLASREFRHTQWFVRGRDVLREGVAAYVRGVREGSFPTERNHV